MALSTEMQRGRWPGTPLLFHYIKGTHRREGGKRGEKEKERGKGRKERGGIGKRSEKTTIGRETR